jgi:hypothetical protein
VADVGQRSSLQRAREYGFDTLILCEKELSDEEYMLEKIRQFEGRQNLEIVDNDWQSVLGYLRRKIDS